MKKRIIYEIYFPAFAMNLKDMTDKLDYVEELGATRETGRVYYYHKL